MSSRQTSRRYAELSELVIPVLRRLGDIRRRAQAPYPIPVAVLRKICKANAGSAKTPCDSALTLVELLKKSMTRGVPISSFPRKRTADQYGRQSASWAANRDSSSKPLHEADPFTAVCAESRDARNGDGGASTHEQRKRRAPSSSPVTIVAWSRFMTKRWLVIDPAILRRSLFVGKGMAHTDRGHEEKTYPAV